MSKLNAKNKSGVIKNKNVAIGVSYNGNIQYVKNAAQQLYELAVTSLYGKDAFYETSDERLARLVSCVNSVVKDGQVNFVANLITHARTVMNIRSMPILLAVYFAKALRDNKTEYLNLRAVTRDVITRADQITDMYSVALSVFGEKGKIPMAIRRGIADAFNKFSEYQFAKYNRDGAVKMKDVLRIVHPVALDAIQGGIFERIIKETLAVPYTWEVELSKNGQLPESERLSKKDLWTNLIKSDKVGYMALLRNLRNIIEADVPMSAIDHVAGIIGDAERVATSKQFPFAFVKAATALDEKMIPSSKHCSYDWTYRNARYNSPNAKVPAMAPKLQKLKDAIVMAIEHSLGNLPQIGENVWVILDCSGSMQGIPMDTGCLFAAALAKSSRACKNFAFTMFSDGAEMINVRKVDSVMTIYEKAIQNNKGGGTNMGAAIRMKSQLGFEPDTVVVISDMQVNQLSGGREDPMKVFKKDTVKIAINMVGYATTPAHEIGGWVQLSGWSDKLFDFIPALRGKDTVVSTLSHVYEPRVLRTPKRKVEDTEAA
jgi:60 kDa SS-A/Ro ribonucleoprotein